MAILRFRLIKGDDGTIITHVIDNKCCYRGEEMPAVKKVPREEIVDAAVDRAAHAARAGVAQHP